MCGLAERALLILYLVHIDSRILIGSVSRSTLKALLDEHMKGVYEHAQQIQEHSDQVIFHRSTVEEDEDQLEIVCRWGKCTLGGGGGGGGGGS